jgi:hypothetical protein
VERHARRVDILAVLRAARVAPLRGGDEADCAAHAVARHGGECVAEVGMPVAHADVHRERHRPLVQPGAQEVGLPQRQLGDRGDPAEHLVVMRDLVDPSRRHAPAAQHIPEKRPHIVGPLGSAEGDEEDGGERITHH